ncbi:MAG: hypothetical protein HUU02_07530 [Bacteroidetes bacterium]|nr:hypothetical protein [Bacteroidota bacterium]
MMTGVVAAYLRTPRVKAAGTIYLLLAAVLSQTPLFNYLGYEFSAAMTVPAAFIAGYLTLHWLSRHRTIPMTGRQWLQVTGVYCTVNGLLLLIPFGIIALNAIVVKNCSFGLGVVYYLLLPVVTMVLAVALAAVTGMVFRRPYIVYTIIVTALLLQILFITLLQPQLYAYNFILGFFPGITYDETLTDLRLLILYRAFTLVAAVTLFAFFFILLRTTGPHDRLTDIVRRMRRTAARDRVLWGAVLTGAAVLGAAHLYRDDLGFEQSAEYIQSALGRRSESAHFIVYYRQEDHAAASMQRLKAEMEYHYRVVTDRLGAAPQENGKIAVYLYPDAAWKQRFIGTANTNIAKPWLREMHLTVGTFAGSFRHELVHIIAGEFGAPLIRASVRMGLNEGLAVATDWDEGMFSPHEYAAALMREGRLDDAARLFTLTGFASRSSTYAYIVSGSFIRYLIERFGSERVREVFPRGTFVTVLGAPLEELMGEWKAFLRTVDASDIPPVTVDALFSSPSILYKVCPRTVAELNRTAADDLRNGRFADAERSYVTSFDFAPSIPALRGLFHALNAQGKEQETTARYAALTNGSLLRSSPPILLALGDSYLLQGMQDSAAAVYQRVTAMHYSEWFTEAALLRSQYMRDAVDAAAFRTIFYGSVTAERRAAVLDSLHRSMPNAVSLLYHQAALSDSSVRPAFNGLPEGLMYAGLVRAAERSMERGAFEEAKALFWEAKNNAPTRVLADRLDERIELCDFTMTELQ